MDLIFYSRASYMFSKGAPPEEKHAGTHAWFQGVCNQDKISPDLTVKTPPSEPQFAAISSDSYLERVQEGMIQIKIGSIQQMEGDTLIFEDGSRVKANAPVFCTGYEPTLPCFDQETLNSLGYKPDDPFVPVLLHKTVFPPSSLAGLAFVGFYRGPFFGTMGLQAEWVCKVFKQKNSVPHTRRH